MGDIVYNSYFKDSAQGNIAIGTHTLKMMLVDGYAPDKSHTKRSDVIADEVTGTGYSAGGQAITPSLVQDNVNNKVTVSFENKTWPAATITATGAVIYRSRGGAASADELLCYIDFGGAVTSTADNFTVSLSTPITVQN